MIPIHLYHVISCDIMVYVYAPKCTALSAKDLRMKILPRQGLLSTPSSVCVSFILTPTCDITS